MSKNHSLIKIIGKDLFQRSKLAMLFFIGLVITALMTILTTNETRILRHEQEQYVVAKRALDIEWRNLILEENTLGEQQRIEQISVQALKMDHILQENEQILVIAPHH